MDLSLHTSIVVVAAILVVLILVDGLKRMMAARAEQKRLSKPSSVVAEEEALDLLRGELPNGGARTLQEFDEESAFPEEDAEALPPYARSIPQHASRPYTPTVDAQLTDISEKEETEDFPSQESDKPVPMLMESVSLGRRVVQEERSSDMNAEEAVSVLPSDKISAGGVSCAKVKSSPSSEKPFSQKNMSELSENTGLDAQSLSNATIERSSHEDRQSAKTDQSSRIDASSRARGDQSLKHPPLDPLFDDIPIDQNPEPQRIATTATLTESVGERLADRPPSEEVLVMHVFSKAETGFEFRKLFALFKACDLRHGEMGVFHRFERANAQGKIQFSIADVVKPGAFDLSKPEATTPGIALFMSLPGPEKPLEAYNTMAEVAQAVARNLNGVVQDEMLSVMTSQTLEHGRQQIMDFNRRQQLARPSMA